MLVNSRSNIDFHDATSCVVGTIRPRHRIRKFIGAISAYVNRHGLTSKEFAAIKAAGEDVETIESRLLKENIGAVKVSENSLKGEDGAKLAMTLLKVLRRATKAGESKQSYEEHMKEQAIETLGLSEVFSS